MSLRRIAVLAGSHDPTYFARYPPPDRPSQAAVLTALRAQRSTSEANHRASATQTLTGPGGSIAGHAGAHVDAGTGSARGSDAGGPPRITALSAVARTRRPTRRRARILAHRTSRA
jgi:hypothetical protein